MFRHNFDDPRFGGIPWYTCHSLRLRREPRQTTYGECYKGSARDLPSPYPAGTSEGRTDASSSAGVKGVARANTAQTLHEEPQLPAGPSFLLQLMQTGHVVNHYPKKTYSQWQASSQLGQGDLLFPSLKPNLQCKQKFWTESPVAALSWSPHRYTWRGGSELLVSQLLPDS